MTATGTVVAQDPSFPCEQLLCVAAGGNSGYCSKKCFDDSSCPGGFTCSEVEPRGLYAGQKFCVFKTCSTAQDCGSTAHFCCQQTAGSTDHQEIRLCAFKSGKSCPP